jgi:hypothetical protein
MTNTLEAELAAAHNSIPADPAPAETLAAPAEKQASCSDLTPGLVRVCAATVFQQWQLTEPELTELGGALGECLDQLFPGGMGGRYACWLRLVAVSAMICATRAGAGGLPPIGPRQPEPEPDPAPIATPQPVSPGAVGDGPGEGAMSGYE